MKVWGLTEKFTMGDSEIFALLSSCYISDGEEDFEEQGHIDFAGDDGEFFFFFHFNFHIRRTGLGQEEVFFS